MSNIIPMRIADFLGRFPPFNLIGEVELLRLARHAEVRYLPKGEVLFRKGGQPGDRIFVVREGAIHLFDGQLGGKVLVDQYDEGDLFGLRPLLVGEPYALTAEAAEDSLVYALKVEQLKKLAVEQAGIGLFLAGSLATHPTTKLGLGKAEGHAFHPSTGGAFTDLGEIQLIEHSKAPVTCTQQNTLQQAAQIMVSENVGSIIVTNQQHHPVGIITDKDFRRGVVTGQLPITAPVSELMSSPVITLQTGLTAAEAQIAMVKYQIHHLCLTQDGTDQSAVVGIISEHDLLLLQGNHPAIFIREIKRATSTDQLREIRIRSESLLHNYLEQEVTIPYIATIITSITDAITRRCIELALEQLANRGQTPPDVPFCWLALGSQGRGEQLLRTDQDNALIFDTRFKGEELEQERDQFLPFTRLVNQFLDEAGFEYCPAEMMAGNPNWCLSVQEWKRQFSQWILEPTPKAILHSTIFFDFRSVYGDSYLAMQLSNHISELLQQESRFLSYLAKNAMENPPPLTFFRNFMVERTGEHKDQFDIKARAMMPLTDAARLLSLQHDLKGITNTFRRFEALKSKESNYGELMEQAGEAYEILMRYRTWRGLQQGDSGRFFNPADLSKMERLNLRNAFRPIRELQSLLSTRFQLALLG